MALDSVMRILTSSLSKTPNFLSAYGFATNQSANLLYSQLKILTTTDPIKSTINPSFEELQFRQDEMDEGFEPAIYALLDLFTRRQKQ